MPQSDSERSDASDEQRNSVLRPPLTSEEIETVKVLRSAFKQTDAPVCCFGHVPFEVRDPKIFYSTVPALATEGSLSPKPQTKGTLAITNVNATELAAFHEACLPAHFGHGTERVYDESYRLAREILPEFFQLNFDPIHESNEILSNVATLCRVHVRSVVYKVNSYGPGGLFRAHKDTPRASDHIGTLVIVLPTVFEGGEFVLRHGPMEHVLDWTVEGRGGHADELHWVFFYSDVEHEIKPVKSGYRITISYNIYGVSRPYLDNEPRAHEWLEREYYADEEYDLYGTGKMPESPPDYQDPEHDAYKAALEKVDLAWELNPIFGGLLDAFKNKSFLPNGGRLAFGLDHEYGLGGHEVPLRTFDWCLKGRDAALFAAVKALGLSYELKAVYKLNDCSDYIENKPRCAIDEFSSELDGEYLLIWNDFSGAGPTGEGDLVNELIYHGADVDFTLVWAHFPTTTTRACRYIRYGNEPTMKTLYVAAALIIDIPRFGTHRRTGTFR